jgi:hypothetical protein
MNARQLFQYSTYSYTALKKCLPVLGYDCKEYHDIDFDAIYSFGERGMVPVVKLIGDSVVVIIEDGVDSSNTPYLKAVSGDTVHKLYAADLNNTSAIVVSGIAHSGQRDIIFERDKVVPLGYAEHIIELRHILEGCHIPKWMVPSLPVLISFGTSLKDSSGTEVRGESHGPNVIIRDIKDPVTVLLHEIGHIYHDTVLTSIEHQKLSTLFMGIDQVSPNGLFRTKYEASTEREYFSTIYMWYLKGIMLAEQYRNILGQLDPAALSFIEDIFERVRSSMINSSVYNAIRPNIESFVLNGRMELMKANRSYNMPTKIIDQVRPTFEYKELAKANSLEWIVATTGALRGKVLVLNDGYIDFKYMKRDKYYMVPRKTFRLTKAGGEYRTIKKNPYLDLVPIAIGQWNNEGERLLLKSEFYEGAEGGRDTIGIIYEQSKGDLSGALLMYEALIQETECALTKASEATMAERIGVLLQRRRIVEAKNILNKLQKELSNVRK